MSLVARGLAYVAALMLAFGAVAPWVVVNGEPVVASPEKVVLVWGLAIASAIATVFQQRRALAVLAVFVAAFAVFAVWRLPHLVAATKPIGVPEYSEATGIAPLLYMGAALLLYLASRLPAPQRARAVVADAEG